MKVIVTPTAITDSKGQPVCNGSLKLELEGPGVLAAGGHVLDIPVHVALDQGGRLAEELRLHGSTEFKWGGGLYRVSVYTQGGMLAREPVDINVASDDESFDLAKAVNKHAA